MRVVHLGTAKPGTEVAEFRVGNLDIDVTGRGATTLTGKEGKSHINPNRPRLAPLGCLFRHVTVRESSARSASSRRMCATRRSPAISWMSARRGPMTAF